MLNNIKYIACRYADILDSILVSKGNLGHTPSRAGIGSHLSGTQDTRGEQVSNEYWEEPPPAHCGEDSHGVGLLLPTSWWCGNAHVVSLSVLAVAWVQSCDLDSVI